MAFGINGIFGKVRVSMLSAQEEFDKAIEKSAAKSLDPTRSRTGQTQYSMRRGDTLDHVASRSKQSLDNILTVNPSINNPRDIDVGVKIIIMDRVRTDAFEEQRAALAKIDKIPRRIATQDTQEAAWDKLQQKVEQELRYVTRSEGAPQKTLNTAVAEIKNRAPDNTQFASVVDLAKSSVSKQLEATGRTPENFDEILKAATKAGNDQKNADTLARSVDDGDHSLKTKSDEATLKAKKSWEAVTNVAGSQLEKLGNGKSNSERETAITARVLTLATFGPDNINYREALDAAVKRELVDEPAKAISDAYDRNGAPAAAFEARKQTKDVSAALAGKILDASDDTLVKVANDLGKEAREKLPAGSTDNPADLIKGDSAFLDHSRKDSRMTSDNTYVVVLGDLSAAVESAAGSDTGATATTRIASTLARTLPDVDDMNYATGERRAHNLEQAFKWVVAEKNGAVLSLEAAKQLKMQGHTEYSQALTGHINDGVKELRKTAIQDVAEFGAAREPFAALEDGPSKLLEPTERQNAMDTARKENPEAARKFDGSLEDVRQSGRALWKTQAAVSAYEPDLGNQKSFKDLKETLAKPESDQSKKDSFGFALEMGSDAVVDIAANDPRIERTELPGVTPWWPLRAGLDLTHELAGKSINQIYDAGQIAAKSPKESPASKGPAPVTGLNSTTRVGMGYRFASSILGGYHVDAMFQSKDFWGTAYGLAFTTTTTRHAAELLGGIGQSAVALSPRLHGGKIDKLSDFVKVERDLWTKSTGAYLKGWLYLDGAYTAWNLSEGKYPEAAIFGTQTIADGLLAFLTKPKWAGPVGLGISFAAAAANYGYGKWKAENTRESFTEDYLKGAHIRPEIAELIADKKDMPLRLDAFARQWCKTDPSAVVDYLNTLEPSTAFAFLNKLAHVEKKSGSGGQDQYAFTAPDDYAFNPPLEPKNKLPWRWSIADTWQDSDPNKPSWIPPQAENTGASTTIHTSSLSAVGLWAFGHRLNFPGRYERPETQPIEKDIFDEVAERKTDSG